VNGEERQLGRIADALSDLYEILAAIAVELEANVEVQRAWVTMAIGHDPMAGTKYDEDKRGMRHHGQEPEYEPEE
jgi:hypothetical protein